MNVPAHIRTALEAYRDFLRARFGDRLEKLMLFGSRARGTAREDSDVDVLVCIRGANGREEDEAVAASGDILDRYGVCLSPAVYSSDRFDWLVSIESPFARSVQRDQVPV